MSSNPQLELAAEYVLNTDKNIFLTGKAGTGKTTFLRKIIRETVKRTVVVAPTGVAAINAGGMTIHSLFQLPFGPFLPNAPTDPSRRRNFSSKKISLIRSLDLVIIDEISMVRADMLDAIDDTLRRYRDRSKPFGGVQLLMIGDLHQLPPVVKREEWELLKQHYTTSYFFGSLALQKTDPITIELNHIYRQADSFFIDLLNKVRNNQMDEQVLIDLNSRYKPKFQPKPDEGYITLTSHNASANKINKERLDSIKSTEHNFKATITGDFPKHAYPTDEELKVKIGAQVVFIKNDPTIDKAYYNGKIGKIVDIQDGVIHIKSGNEYGRIEVEPVEWENIKYELDDKTKEVKENVVGTFKHYPIKLAWAITIHKSQGLTFEKAIIDAKSAFAHGQVYVALSRCKTFEGIVLKSKIEHKSVRTDRVVKHYSAEASKNQPNEKQLEVAKQAYQQNLLRELFSFQFLTIQLKAFEKILMDNDRSFSVNPYNAFKVFEKKVEDSIISIGNKFLPQLEQYFREQMLPEDNLSLQHRIKGASVYFSDHIKKILLPEFNALPLQADSKSVRGKVVEGMHEVKKQLYQKYTCFGVSKHNFTVHQYIKAKTKADLEYKQSDFARSSKMTAYDIPDAVQHPDLFISLVEWRDKISNRYNLSKNEVVSTKAIIEITKYLPTNTRTLDKIKGIGRAKILRYGSAIISMIEMYCSKNNVQTNLIQFKPKKKDTKEKTFDLYQEGNSILEIAELRGVTPKTIETHFIDLISRGKVEVSDVLDKKVVDEISEYITNSRPKSLKDIRQYFEDKYEYNHIRMVMKSIDAENR